VRILGTQRSPPQRKGRETPGRVPPDPLAATHARRSGALRRARIHQAVGRPYPALYFCQVAKLFPGATLYVFEHRAQGYKCGGELVEIDVRPFFPIHADDKESRFDRAIHFYSTDRPTMQALESYVIREYNKTEPDKIAGVALTRIQTPIPAPGSAFPRYGRKPLSDYPEKERQVFYHTTKRVLTSAARRVTFDELVKPNPLTLPSRSNGSSSSGSCASLAILLFVPPIYVPHWLTEVASSSPGIRSATTGNRSTFHRYRCGSPCFVALATVASGVATSVGYRTRRASGDRGAASPICAG
jgi:hypothetical protein